MNSVILSKNISINEVITLSPKASSHLKEVVGVKSGDQLKGTILNKGLCNLEVVEVNENVQVKVLDEREGVITHFDLIVGASRPQTMKKVLEHGSSLGVKSFNILKAELSEKSYLQSKIYQDEGLKNLTHLGLSQSACFFQEPSLEKFFSINALKSKSETIKQKLILDPYAEETLLEQDLDMNKTISLAIGPERGWTKEEICKFNDLGYKSVRISPSILRVENATIAALAILGQKL